MFCQCYFNSEPADHHGHGGEGGYAPARDHRSDREHADQQRDTRTIESAHEQIAAVAVGSEPVAVGKIRRLTNACEVDLIVGVRAQVRREDCEQCDDREQNRSDDSGAVAQQPRSGIAPQAATFDVGLDGGDDGCHQSYRTLGSKAA